MPKLRRIPSSSNSSSSAVATDQPVSGVYSRRSINGRMPSEERAINIAEMMGATPGVDDVDAAPMQREAVNAAKVFSISGGNSVSIELAYYFIMLIYLIAKHVYLTCH